jgi:hypothetical protein
MRTPSDVYSSLCPLVHECNLINTYNQCNINTSGVYKHVIYTSNYRVTRLLEGYLQKIPVLRLNFPWHSAREIFRFSTCIFRKFPSQTWYHEKKLNLIQIHLHEVKILQIHNARPEFVEKISRLLTNQNPAFLYKV